MYDELPRVLADLGPSGVQGVLFDLGVSSMQLDEPRTGLRLRPRRAPGHADGRQQPAITAAEVLNTYSAADLASVLSRYGEERFARRIADRVVRERAEQPFDTSARLVDLVRAAIPAAARRTGGNPAKRTFQALRIEVNDELAVLERALPAAIDALCRRRPHRRDVVPVARGPAGQAAPRPRLARRPRRPTCRSSRPSHEPELRLLTRGAERATDDEIAANPRAASVRVRAAERIREVA